MFGLLDLFTKRIHDQIAGFAAVQADITRQLWETWLAPLQTRRPATIPVERNPSGNTAAQRRF